MRRRSTLMPSVELETSVGGRSGRWREIVLIELAGTSTAIGTWSFSTHVIRVTTGAMVELASLILICLASLSTGHDRSGLLAKSHE
ncbi:MAG: hypothetical protein CMJ32_10055 [Phycisphaerae bacterium]|nr:hypothetical protein [Phycisphaerae bacterium]